jgi:hypothetical protein
MGKAHRAVLRLAPCPVSDADDRFEIEPVQRVLVIGEHGALRFIGVLATPFLELPARGSNDGDLHFTFTHISERGSYT